MSISIYPESMIFKMSKFSYKKNKIWITAYSNNVEIMYSNILLTIYLQLQFTYNLEYYSSLINIHCWYYFESISI